MPPSPDGKPPAAKRRGRPPALDGYHRRHRVYLALTDEEQARLQAYVDSLEPQPALAEVCRTALLRFLRARNY